MKNDVKFNQLFRESNNRVDTLYINYNIKSLLGRRDDLCWKQEECSEDVEAQSQHQESNFEVKREECCMAIL